jgi:hypothetical protein
MKLNVKAFAFTTAIIWGLGLFLMTWWVILFQGAGFIMSYPEVPVRPEWTDLGSGHDARKSLMAPGVFIN